MEAEETYVGGLNKNRHSDKNLWAGRSPSGKAAVVGVKDRDTNQVSTAPVASTDAQTLQSFVRDRVDARASVYSGDNQSYRGLSNH